MRFSLTLIAVTLATTASAQVTTRDSAGVQIRTTSLARATAPFAFSERPVLDMGGADADVPHEFHRISSVIRLRNGTVVVANGSSFEVRYFSATGALIRTAGRKGSGPGEFTNISTAFPTRGDSVLVVDDLARRFSVFTPDGRLVTSAAVTPPDGRRSPRLVGIMGDNTIIGSSPDRANVDPNGRPHYFASHLFGYGFHGSATHDAGAFYELEAFPQALPAQNGRPSSAYWNLAFGRNATVRGTNEGFATGDGTAFEVQMRSRTGAVRSILRVDERRAPVTDADKAWYRESTGRGLSGPDADNARRRAAEMPFPALKPAYHSFLIGRDGRVWIRRYPANDATEQRWVVLAPTGAFVSELTLPARFTLHGADAETAWGVQRDDDGVEHAQVWGFRRAN
ncbi:MAG TPA: hypothetical protein VJR92_11105 [Gemmatimonadaceae bacterium]|nr:hypothetical protein [Gemmatimonadaceae bacterium]